MSLLSEASSAVVFNAIGNLLSALAEQPRQYKTSWYRVLPVENKEQDKVGGKQVPIRTTADLFNESYHTTMDLLLCAGLIKKDNRYGKWTVAKQAWNLLQGRFKLHGDSVPDYASEVNCLGQKVWVFRVGSWYDDPSSPFPQIPFTAAHEAYGIRHSDPDFAPKRFRLTEFINDFHFETMSALSSWRMGNQPDLPLDSDAEELSDYDSEEEEPTALKPPKVSISPTTMHLAAEPDVPEESVT